jgi:hypothetical protein
MYFARIKPRRPLVKVRTPKVLALVAAPVAFALSVFAFPAGSSIPGPVAKVLSRNCTAAGCHSGKYPAMNLNLESPRNIEAAVDRPSAEKPDLKVIDRTNPERSYLLAKISGAADIQGKRMPLDKPPLAEPDLKLVRDWVMSLKAGESAPPDGERAGDQPFVRPAFWGLTLANLPTTTTLDRNRFLFRISHRFLPSVRVGWDSMYGLDGPAAILIGFGFGISDRLTATLGRTNDYDIYEIGLHWVAADQGRLPFSAALHLGGALAADKIPGRDVWDSRNIKLSAQLSLVRQFSGRFSVALVPSYSTHADHWTIDGDPRSVFALGVGGRFMILKEISLIGEWTPVLAGYEAPFTGWVLGIEKKIGGHVFQVFVLNSTGLTADIYAPGGDLRLADGDFRLGFNIYRTF